MVENLLDENLNNNQYRLLEEADTFDLEEFYLDKYASSGGVCLITNNQMIMTDCYIKQSKYSNYGMHIDTVDAMYKAIYGISGPKEFKNWQEKILEDGNILIQLCSLVPSLIWIPEEISENQKEFLTAFSNRVNQIVAFNRDYFKENPIIFECFIEKGQNILTENSIEEVIKNIKVKEVKNGKRF